MIGQEKRTLQDRNMIAFFYPPVFSSCLSYRLRSSLSCNVLTLNVFTFLFLLLPWTLYSIDLSPWLGRNYEVETQGIYRFQSYHEIKTPNGTIRRNAHDNFLILNASLTGLDYKEFKEKLNVQIEGMVADTHRQDPAIDCLSATLRYRWLNDITNNCISVTPGFTVIKAFRKSLLDPGSFHHGQIELETHVAIGKEFSCEDFWTHRLWGIAAVGIGDHGQPWIRGDINWEKNWWNQQRLLLYVHTLWGLGRDNLAPYRHFTGYGRIRHQSVDVGIKHTYFFDCGLGISTEYAYRVYALNFPTKASQFMLSLYYPIGL